MATARQAAFDVLLKMNKGAFSNVSLDAALSSGIKDARERALASMLVYGVTERRLTLDALIKPCLDRPMKKMKADVLTVLRMGVYQLFYTDRIPVSAAVNESVNLAKKNGCAYAAGLVNAVLRKVHSRGLVLPECENEIERMSIEFSCEEWIVKMLAERYGEENTRGILSSSLEARPITLRVNTVKTNTKALLEQLDKEGIKAVAIGKNAVRIEKTGAPMEKLPSFRKGMFHVQDKACQLCCAALDVKSGNTVFDLCAAPGGKSFTIAQMMGNYGTVKSFDIYPHKTELIDEGAHRLGLNIIQSCVADATVYRASLRKADRVLCDVPCSGFGIIGAKPEIKYKKEQEVAELPDIQYRILENAASYLADGGRLVYSTCTLNPAENEEVCNRFLKEHTDFICVDPSSSAGENKSGEYVTLLPHKDGCDGFFFAAFERKEA